jgi:hypothetical protein
MEVKNVEVEDPKEWHKQQEEILKRWSEIGSSYRFMHDRSFTKFNTQNFRFALPVIVISTVTGTANFAQSSFPPSWAPYVPLGIGFLNLTAGLLTTVAQFLRVSELLEGHRAAAISYSKFSRNISVELSLPREDRSKGGTEFVNTCRIELDRLIEQSPNIPIGIIKQFGKRFADSTFMKPEILNITSVQVYRDVEKERTIKKLEEIKNSENIKGEILLGEQKRRKSILLELMNEKKNEELNFRRMSDLKKKKRKENMTLGSVGDSMAKLISKLQNADTNGDCITPTSSNTSSEDNSLQNTFSVLEIEKTENTGKTIINIADIIKDVDSGGDTNVIITEVDSVVGGDTNVIITEVDSVDSAVGGDTNVIITEVDSVDSAVRGDTNVIITDISNNDL